MTDSRGSGRVPVTHVISRVLLGGLVLSLAVAAVVLVVLHGAGELAFGQSIWGAIKYWTLPW